MTDIELYDTAVYQYLDGLGKRVLYSPTSKARKEVTKLTTTDEKIPWGFLSFYRSPNFEYDPSRDNFAARNFGDHVSSVAAAASNVKGTYVHNIPINLTYNIDVWAATRSEVQELAIKVLSKLAFTDRVLTAPINPDEVPARFHILDLDWVDNSDIEDEESVGRIYRHTISFTIDARLKLVRTTNVTLFDYSKIPINIYEGDDLEHEVCTKCDYKALGIESGDPDC